MRPIIAIPEPHTRRDYTEKALKQYTHAVELAGGQPLVVRLDQPNDEIARQATLASAIVLPGSPADLDPQKYGEFERDPHTAPSDPRRDNADELLLQDAFNLRKPILAICYGLQSLNVWRTGTLIQHLPSQPVEHQAKAKEGRAHALRVEPGTRLQDILAPELRSRGEPWVNSSHHQAVATPGDGLRIAARCPDDGVIEAVEGTASGHFVLGVQWHPERMVDDDAAARALFRALVGATRPVLLTPDY